MATLAVLRRFSYILGLAASIQFASAQTLETLARGYHATPTPAARGELLRYASLHGKDVNGALALLVVGAADTDAGRYADALIHLRIAEKRLPKLADYIQFQIATAEYALNDASAAKTANRIWDQSIRSPLAPKAALLAARAHLLEKKPKQALEILKKHYGALPQPQGDYLLATTYEAAGDFVNAVTYYQRTYYYYPLSAEASLAEASIDQFRNSLGDNYPPAMPHYMLARANKLIEGGNPKKGRQELEAIIPLLGGNERELARVGIGVVDYTSRDTEPAFRYLRGLQVNSPEADAERLFYVLSCARRLGNEAVVKESLARLAQSYPTSNWRIDALIAIGTQYTLTNKAESYEPLFRACYEALPDDPRTAQCHWRVAFGEYLRRRADAGDMLKAHLVHYPKSDKVSAAMYFLGRLSESSKDAGAARAWYEAIDNTYPNHYYAMLARDRLKDAEIARAALSIVVRDFLKTIPFPPRNPGLSFEISSIAAQRIERSRLLASCGLDDWAEGELRFGAKLDEQPQLLAMEAAQIATRRGAPDQGVRYIKSMVTNYLSLPLETAPFEFWKLAFPLPFRGDLERYAKERSVDPYLMAGLIRQESEFNPKAISKAKAYGLTQILPDTGRELSRRLRKPRFTSNMLFLPALNLELGTFYFRSLNDELKGRTEATLAAYNAGKSRAVNWLGWNDFREPAEFIESIPFSETRGYVQFVLRNADFYRRLYTGRPTEPYTAAATVTPTPAVKKTTSTTRKRRRTK